MATGKYSRVGGRKTSRYCSIATIVIFVVFCFVGIWMFMSSSIVSVKDSEILSLVTGNEAKQSVPKGDSKQFDDTSGDLSGADTREDGGSLPSKVSGITDEDNSTKNLVVESNNEEKESHNSAEENQEETHANESSHEKTELESAQKRMDEDDEHVGKEAILTERKNDENQDVHLEQSEVGNRVESKEDDQASTEILHASSQSEILTESTTRNGARSTQAVKSLNEKKSQHSFISNESNDHHWKLCKTTAGPDYIPCLDNWKVIRKLPSTSHYEHRERHCPDEAPTCLVPLPQGYKRSVKWPKSRDKIWYYNVPHTKLAEVKGHQNWVKVTGEYLTFPGGGTQFVNGALHYIDFIQNAVPQIAWGERTRVILDVGCGVASFGGFLFERDVLAMSFAPKDEHEAQVQFALERGIPAILNVMGTKRLPFPSSVFDLVHCARCRVPWHVEGGKLLLELNRVLRSGGYFVWSATPVYRKGPEDLGIWQEMSRLTKSMCWDLVVVKRDKLNNIGAAIYRKPTSNDCYKKRSKNAPPLCEEFDDPNAAWDVPLQACMHKVPIDSTKRGSLWPAQWPLRLQALKAVVSQSYLKGMGIDWSSVRNVMDMKAVYGGFAAALKDLKVWVMNVVPIDSPDTLPIIYERGLFGIYHDWCESFNTYPRTYDVLHADHLFSSIKQRCKLVTVIAEVDRILRPEGKLIIRDNSETISEVEGMVKSLQWEIRMIYSKDNEGLLCVCKTFWRPTEVEPIKNAIV
ncbi:putative methyltransferase PMT26 [Hibiscus syriacus]|uniref:Methyltransferase PMT26 n=1 Tax=Hibiscus syriacus TaxID=106335 RepID=A0A6A2WDD4_HIBSY|nr:putative methyltransferase PMT26 [Hibiscus syriacus]